jgi:hypothetical protein
MQVNGVADECLENNHYQTTFEVPPVYPEDLVLWVRTNAAGNETRLYVKDVDGNVVFSKTNYQSNTLHKDTVNLPMGCYKIELNDTGEDGLDFFANNDGTGFFQIRKLTSAPLAGFESNFGKNIIHYFTVGYGLSINETNHKVRFSCYPNPAREVLNVASVGFTGDIKIQIFDASGRRVFQEMWPSNYLNNTKKVDISNFENGVYIIQMSDNFNTHTQRFICQ